VSNKDAMQAVFRWRFGTPDLALYATVFRAVFRCRFGTPDLALCATVFLSEHCSVFCFLVHKFVQILIN
jgi:hypothetical protein